jgi:hypothetical protein
MRTPFGMSASNKIERSKNPALKKVFAAAAKVQYPFKIRPGTRKPASGNSILPNSNTLTGYLTAEGINTKRLAAP